MGRTSALCLFFVACSISFSSSVVSSVNELSLAVAQPTALQISPSFPVKNSPGSRPGAFVLCERVHICGLSRLKNLRKFAHLVKVRVSNISSNAHLRNVEVCFHRIKCLPSLTNETVVGLVAVYGEKLFLDIGNSSKNINSDLKNISLGIGMCPRGKWEKLVKGSWVQSMSPFDHKILDICMAGSSVEVIQVYVEEEFFLYRIIFLITGIVIMTLASSLSKSLVFYYSSAMAIGIILVILMVLFQGMKLLPTGRKNSIAIFVYSSIVGLGSFLLRYLPRLLHSVLAELGISEDMYNPLSIFLLIFLVLSGAWLGFWAVRKLVLTEDGLIDIGVSHFVAWSIRIIASVMILQSSHDPLLAAEALLIGILVSSIFRRIIRSRWMRHLYKDSCRMDKRNHRYQIPGSSPLNDSYDEYVHNIQKPQSRPFTMASCGTPVKGLTKTPPIQLLDSDPYYSSFHKTSERRKFSKDEWEKFTKDSTKKALEELLSSPDFSKWAVANAERVTLTPNKATPDRPRRWFPWS